jgi:phage terminase large subunit GpA
MAWRKADRRSIQDWARSNVDLPAVLTRSGKFATVTSRHFDGPLYALRHNRVRGVRILKPVRGGGTLIADVAAPWAIVNDHASILRVFQDDPIAGFHAESRGSPMLMSVPAIRSMVSDDPHKTRKTDILFSNGLPLSYQGPALGGLQSRGFKWVMLDECWMFKPGVISQAKGRMGDFVKMSSNKFLAISQGGEEESDWDFEYQAGVEFIWMPLCAGCAEPMPLEWTLKRNDGTTAGAVFDSVKNADDSYNKDASAATVRYVCPNCGHSHENSERTRAAWNKSGDYYSPKNGERFDPLNPPTEVSFRWHSLVDYPWAELVKEWLSAQEAKHVGNFAPLVNFFQKRCALMRSDKTIHDSDVTFFREKIDHGVKTEKAWPDETHRFLSVDRQQFEDYWATVRAWSKSGESRRLWFGRLHGAAQIEEKRIEYAVAENCTVVDSGHWAKGENGVYEACIKYNWIALKGDDPEFFWHSIRGRNGETVRVQRPWAPVTQKAPGTGYVANGRSSCPLILFSAPTMSHIVTGLIKSGRWVEPETEFIDEMERQYRIQMTSEFLKAVKNKITFRTEMKWSCPSGNNHAFDCAKMQVLCAMQAKLLPQGLEVQPTPPPTE